MTEPVRISDATSGPVTLEMAKLHLRVETDEEDDLIDQYLASANAFVERRTGRALAQTDWQWVMDKFPAGDLVLPHGPVSLVDSISYIDPAGATQVMDAADLIIDLSQVEARISAPDGWPATADRIACVTVIWTAAAELVPPDLVQAVLMLVHQWFEDRTSKEIPRSVMELVNGQRRFKG
jgi:uncharacterized phiE125 gp8 family phage protein